MIDERHEELAALYALDLLEGEERTAFERALAADPELRTLAQGLREASAALAHTAPQVAPPPALRDRVLASISQSRIETPKSKILRFPAWIPWATAASFAIIAAWWGQRAHNFKTEAQLLRQQQAFADLSLKTLSQQLEAERILAGRRLVDTQKLADDSSRQLADARTQLTEVRGQLSERDTRIASLTQRVETLTATGTELDRTLNDTRQRVAALTEQLKTQGDLANFKITALASMLNNTPAALAVAVWNPANQEGVLQVDKLPALAADKDYQLWVVDPQYPNPVDGGVFTVNETTGATRVQFKAKQPIKSINAFAVTLERKGGVPKAEGPFVLLGK